MEILYNIFRESVSYEDTPVCMEFKNFVDQYDEQSLRTSVCYITDWVASYCREKKDLFKPMPELDISREHKRIIANFVNEVPRVSDYFCVEGCRVKYRDEIPEETRRQIKRIASEILSVCNEVLIRPKKEDLVNRDNVKFTKEELEAIEEMTKEYQV